MSDPVVKSLVKKILQEPLNHGWTLQGLGMLRLYLDNERRLHVWDDRYKVPNVSKMHTHPWNFRSLVVAGQVENTKYIESGNIPYFKQKIFCGEGGGLVGTTDMTYLEVTSIETYRERESYEEHAHEIHVSRPARGSVTIIKRQFLADVDHAYVYWKDGEWVSAEPRQATIEEIAAITQYSLKTWFN